MNPIDIAATIIANARLLFFLEIVWIIATCWGAWDCLTRLEGIDRLTWLVAMLAMPVVGIVFYLMHGIDESKTRRLKTLDDL